MSYGMVKQTLLKIMGIHQKFTNLGQILLGEKVGQKQSTFLNRTRIDQKMSKKMSDPR
jgi:hypothetical protein